MGGEFPQKLLHQLNLPHGTQESRENALKFQVELFPFCHIGGHGIGKILYIKAVKARVVGENRRGQWTALDAQMGNQRQRHRNGTPSKAGEIVDHRNFFLMIMGQGKFPLSEFCRRKRQRLPHVGEQ